MKKKVYDCVKWLLDNNLDNPRNTLNGNTKLQKMLFFAQLISIAKNNKLLFDNQFNAFANGMVIEDIRIIYKNNISKLLNYSTTKLSQEDLDVLNLTKEIFGNENADTLSEMSHNFSYWNKYFQKSLNPKKKYRDKNESLVPNSELWTEIDRMKDILEVHEEMKSDNFNNDESY